MDDINRFLRSVSDFRGRLVPEKEALLVGYSSLIDAYNLNVILPEKLAIISSRHKRYDLDQWSIYTPRHKPENTIIGHLAFALRYEAIDLAVLRAIFMAIDAKVLETWVKREPTGQYSRRAWFLYEWLIDKQLNIPNAITGNFVDAIDFVKQYTSTKVPSKRHRVNNNLPGTKNFCPLVRRTPKLEAYINMDLSKIAREEINIVHSDILARAAAFLLLKDSRASFAIEGENVSNNRAERWGQAIAFAGKTPLSLQELLRLQKVVIGDTRFVKLGLRQEGGFIGVHDRRSTLPVPDHISAKWEDVEILMDGLVETNNILKNSQIDAVISAAVVAFGFVFIHPFSDGNGRLHRYLIHHVLAECHFTPKNIAFPISSVILERIDEYKDTLESYSRPRLSNIEWRATEDGNVVVLNETIDLYRYFDATKQAEFLYDCVAQTIAKTIPEEILYLERYDRMKVKINQKFDMPDYKVDLLIKFLEQNKGILSKRAKEKEFNALLEEECMELEKLYSSIFHTGH